MCLGILKSPVSAIAEAKKKRDLNRTIITLLEISAISGIAAALMAVGTENALLLVGSFLSSASVFVILAVFLGIVVNIAARTLGGKGDYYEGLTATTYALLPASIGLLATSILSFAPMAGDILSFFVLFPVIASTLSILYRSVKDLYKTDMMTSFVTVSITLTTLVLTTLFFSSLALA